MPHRRPLRVAAALTAALLLSAAAATAPTGAASATDERLPTGRSTLLAETVELDRPASGRAAVRALGAGLPAAAALNGLTPPELREILLEDPTAWVGRQGRLFHREPVHAGPDRAEPAAAPIRALADTFALHSLPGAAITLYLDFDGAQISGTEWNRPWANEQGQTVPGLPAGTYPGWDPAGDGPAFSATERAEIQAVWTSVAEDYAPFSVDVTTQLPPAAAIDRASAADQTYGTRVVVTSSPLVSFHTCENLCSGVAFTDVLSHYPGLGNDPTSHTGYQPALVFPHLLGGSTKAVAETVAHEAGHTLGLLHHGQGADEYYEGHGSWAPIMGASFDRSVTQFSNGSYAGATKPDQDDLAVIGAELALRLDEASGSTALPATLPSGSAYITGREDVDVYRLGTCTGPTSVAASVAEVSPNLDLEVRILDAVGATVASATGRGATASRTLADGTYFVSVDGIGRGTPSASYDDYGSVGAYSLAVDGCDLALPAGVPSAPLAPTTTVTPTSVTLSWSPPASPGDGPVSGYVVSRSGAQPVEIGAGRTSHTFTGLRSSTRYAFTVAARNPVGTGATATTTTTTAAAPAMTPSAPRALAATWRTADRTALITWQPPSHPGDAAAFYQIAIGNQAVCFADGCATHATAILVPGLAAGRTYLVRVRAVNAAGASPYATVNLAVPAPVTRPGAPRIGAPKRGAKGAPYTATARWSPPTHTGGAAVTRYRVTALQLNGRGKVVRKVVKVVPGTQRSLSVKLRKAQRYRFTVEAQNSAGYGAPSARSRPVLPR